MKTVQIYDKPMCCSTGVCGPKIDPVLPRFAADLEWLRSQGHQVDRFNLAQQPDAFTKNDTIHKLLASQGTKCLPVRCVVAHEQGQRRTVAPKDRVYWYECGPVSVGGSWPLARAGGMLPLFFPQWRDF